MLDQLSIFININFRLQYQLHLFSHNNQKQLSYLLALISIVGMPDKTSTKYLKVIAEILDDWEANQNGYGEMFEEM